MTEIRSAIETASAYLREHPEEARYTDQPAIATLTTGLRVITTGRDGESVDTDMVAAVGGSGSAPSPGWLLRASEASCVATLIAMRAAQLGKRIVTLEVEVDSESDDRGILGIDDSIPAGPLSSRIGVRLVVNGASKDEIDELVQWGVEHCPVADAVKRAVPLSVSIRS